MTSLNNGAPASALPAYLKSEIEALEEQLLGFADAINQPKNLGDAAFYIELQGKAENKLAAKKAEYHAAIIANLPEPTPLIQDVSQATPYPVEQLPVVIREAVHAIAEKVKAPVALAGQCVIGAVVYLALTKADVEDAIGEAMPLNIAMLSLADSGDRKSTCHRLAFRPIAEQQMKLSDKRRLEIEDYNQGRKGLKGKELQDYESSHDMPDDLNTLYSDATFERITGDLIGGKSLVFWDTDEGGQMLSGHSLKNETRVATIGGLTKLLDHGTASRMRSRGNAEASGTAYHRRFGIHLMAQSVAVSEALNDPMLRGQGLLARFLLTAPKSLAGTRMLTAECYAKQRQRPDSDLRIKRYWERVSGLLMTDDYIDADTGNVMPPMLGLTREAEHLWLDLYNDTERDQGRFEKLGDVKQFAARTGDQARKLAAAFAVFEGLDHVDAKCMESAVAIVRHSISEWLRHAESSTIDVQAQRAVTVLEWLTSPSRAAQWAKFTKDQFGHKGFKPFRSAKKRDAVLSTLVQSGHLITTDDRTFIVNPRTTNLATGAESADCAENQQRQGFGSAERVRTSAEKQSEVSASGNKSALIRTSSAHANPRGVDVSAQSAQSAPTPAKKAIEVRLAL